MNAIVVFGVFLMSFLSVQAQEIPVLDGHQPQKPLSLTAVAAGIKPGQIVVMGENHGLKTAQQAQVELLKALRDQGLKVSVGMEFFYYPDQQKVDAFRQNAMPEDVFLKDISWGQPAFDFYRDQVLFPRYDLGERTLALNAPRSLTSRVAKVGFGGLTAEEQKLLPPNFQLGRDTYKKRFLDMMPHLPDAAAGERYFAAQSVWDDTMAWQATEYIAQNPDQVLVIVVGDFHAQYFGGLPDRIQARSGQKPVVFSYVNGEGLTAQELQEQVEPSTVYGPRGDYIWLASEKMPN